MKKATLILVLGFVSFSITTCGGDKTETDISSTEGTESPEAEEVTEEATEETGVETDLPEGTDITTGDYWEPWGELIKVTVTGKFPVLVFQKDNGDIILVWYDEYGNFVQTTTIEKDK